MSDCKTKKFSNSSENHNEKRIEFQSQYIEIPES